MAARDEILNIIRNYPGLHLRAVARQADTSLNLVQYHVQGLSDAGEIELGLDGGKVRAYPPGLPTRQRQLLGALREPKRAAIISHLLQGPSSHADMARALKIGKSTLSFHLSYLAEAGIIERADAVSLANPEAVRDVMAQYKQTPGAVDRLTSLWGKLYDG